MITLVQYIPRDQWLIWLWAGWEIIELRNPHGQYSVMATKEVVDA